MVFAQGYPVQHIFPISPLIFRPQHRHVIFPHALSRRRIHTNDIVSMPDVTAHQTVHELQLVQLVLLAPVEPRDGDPSLLLPRVAIPEIEVLRSIADHEFLLRRVVCYPPPFDGASLVLELFQYLQRVGVVDEAGSLPPRDLYEAPVPLRVGVVRGALAEVLVVGIDGHFHVERVGVDPSHLGAAVESGSFEDGPVRAVREALRERGSVVTDLIQDHEAVDDGMDLSHFGLFHDHLILTSFIAVNIGIAVLLVLVFVLVLVVLLSPLPSSRRVLRGREVLLPLPGRLVVVVFRQLLQYGVQVRVRRAVDADRIVWLLLTVLFLLLLPPLQFLAKLFEFFHLLLRHLRRVHVGRILPPPVLVFHPRVLPHVVVLKLVREVRLRPFGRLAVRPHFSPVPGLLLRDDFLVHDLLSLGVVRVQAHLP